ncbi:MAG: ribonuclease HII [Chloroflexi bacterium RBG_16_50_9]|nr:MAG: ribonuclease HII [Chloroflexi bacterium RBG_16_50_9]
MASTRRKPTFAEEKLLQAEGYRLIAGIDEVGRGALVGPVVAAAVVLPQHIKARWRVRVRDSKQLRPAAREFLSDCIREAAISVGIGATPPDVIDARGIARATRLAMKSAIEQLLPPPQYLLIDYIRLPEVSLPQKGVRDGDSLCFSIACASIVAKVARDRIMVELDAVYPGYGLAEHKGYGTRQHLACLRRFGPCPVHRRSFLPVREIAEGLFRNLSPGDLK